MDTFIPIVLSEEAAMRMAPRVYLGKTIEAGIVISQRWPTANAR